jgi:hypothetical protein
VLDRHRDRRHRGVGCALAVEGDHLANIHAVDVVGGKNGDKIRVMRLHDVEVLVHRVGGSLELSAEGVRARQEHFDRPLAVGKPRRPSLSNVLDERLGLVLREHVNR